MKKQLTIIIMIITLSALLPSCRDMIADFEEYSRDDIEDLVYVRISNGATLGGLYVSRDNGVSFKQISSLNYPFAADQFGNIIFVNPGLNIYMRDNDGDFVSLGTYAGTSQAAAAGDGTIYIGGSSMYRWKYKKSIINYSDMIDQITSPPTAIADDWFHVLSHNDKKIIMLYDGGSGYVSSDNGNVYTLTTGMTDILNLDSNTLLGVNNTIGNTIFKSEDGGASFTQFAALPLGGNTASEIAIDSNGRIFVTSPAITNIVYSDGDLNTWNTSINALPFSPAIFEAGKEGRLFISDGGNADLYFTDDSGNSFGILYSFPHPIYDIQTLKGVLRD